MYCVGTLTLLRSLLVVHVSRVPLCTARRVARAKHGLHVVSEHTGSPRPPRVDCTITANIRKGTLDALRKPSAIRQEVLLHVYAMAPSSECLPLRAVT